MIEFNLKAENEDTRRAIWFKKKKNPNTVNKTFYLPSFLPFLFQILACFFIKLLTGERCQMEFPLALSTATKTLCVDSVVEMATTVYYQKDTPWPGKTFIQSCCSEKVYDVITRSYSYIYNYISGWGDGQTGQSLVV